MSIANFMKDVLIHPQFGYYTKKESIFGEAGDFETAPELSHMFCSLVGVWANNAWQNIGRPQKLNLVELGKHVMLGVFVFSHHNYKVLEEAH